MTNSDNSFSNQVLQSMWQVMSLEALLATCSAEPDLQNQEPSCVDTQLGSSKEIESPESDITTSFRCGTGRLSSFRIGSHSNEDEQT